MLVLIIVGVEVVVDSPRLNGAERRPSVNVADAFFLAFRTLFDVFVDYLPLYNVGPKVI